MASKNYLHNEAYLPLLYASSETIPLGINKEWCFNLSDYNYKGENASFVKPDSNRAWGCDTSYGTTYKNKGEAISFTTKESCPYLEKNTAKFSTASNDDIAKWASPFTVDVVGTAFPYYICYNDDEGGCKVYTYDSSTNKETTILTNKSDGIYVIIQAAGGAPSLVTGTSNRYYGGAGGGACCVYLNCANLPSGYEYDIEEKSGTLCIYLSKVDKTVTPYKIVPFTSLAYAYKPTGEYGDTGIKGGGASPISYEGTEYKGTNLYSVIMSAPGGSGSLPNYVQGGNVAKATIDDNFDTHFFYYSTFNYRKAVIDSSRNFFTTGLGGLPTSLVTLEKVGGAGGSLLSCMYCSAEDLETANSITFEGGYGYGGSFISLVNIQGQKPGDSCVLFLKTINAQPQADVQVMGTFTSKMIIGKLLTSYQVTPYVVIKNNSNDTIKVTSVDCSWITEFEEQPFSILPGKSKIPTAMPKTKTVGVVLNEQPITITYIYKGITCTATGVLTKSS